MMNSFERFQTFIVQQAAKEGAISEPIVNSAAFSYGSPQMAEAIFAGEVQKPLYSRMGNPTNSKLERCIAAIDEAEGAVVTSSGMGAIAMVVSAFLQSGDEVVAVGGLFGGTYAFFTQTLPRFGIKVRFFKAEEEITITDATKMIYCESVGNPTLSIVDFEKLSHIAQKHNILFVVDNTLTPLLVEPFKWGADIVVYSTTKIISGQAQALGGAVVFKEPREGLFETFDFLEKFHKNLDKKAIMGVLKKRALRDYGMSMSAYHTYLTLLGLETLPLRLQRVNESAQKVAKAMEEKIDVLYEQKSKYFPYGVGQMMSFDFGSKEKALQFLQRSKLVYITANIGDSRTLALHMASTIYRDFSSKEREFFGISDGLVRISIGLENPDAIIEDFTKAIVCI